MEMGRGWLGHCSRLAEVSGEPTSTHSFPSSCASTLCQWGKCGKNNNCVTIFTCAHNAAVTLQLRAADGVRLVWAGVPDKAGSQDQLSLEDCDC